ncbi:MAG TPA: protein-methionine-sulfoxide reductase heme-binding subunit MsrQ [Methylophaga sp.]|nr:protein-methionine-sulfoxide reductase heme-binding subunit MsrQ [Methylophaga sp.]
MVPKIKKLLFVVCLIPAIWLTFALFTDQLGANPVEAVTRQTGLWALRFLWLTLLITPLRWMTGWNDLIKFRRLLGLYVFFYAVLHMLLYLGLDQSFAVGEIINDIIKRPFITIGFFSFIALIPLAITSNNAMVKRLGGRRWKKLHRLTYVIAIASSIHFYMLVKLDKTEPLIYIALLVILLAPRVYGYAKSIALKR